MKHTTQTARNGRSPALLRLLGIWAAAALLALLWTAAGAAAQSAPAVTAAYGGLAGEAGPSIRDQISASDSTFTLDERAPGSLAFDSANSTWLCENLRCHYLDVSWSGIAPNPDAAQSPYTVTLTRYRTPSAEDIGVEADEFAATLVPTQVSLPIRGADTGQRYVPVPWPGERLTVTVNGAAGSEASDLVKIPAVGRTPAFSSRAAAYQVGSTLQGGRNSSLPGVVSVWPKVEGATNYEVQYTIRTRSREREQRLTRVIYITDYRHLDSEGGDWYGELNLNWGQHPNAEFADLAVSDFDEDGDWMLALIDMRIMLGGAPGWPDGKVIDGDLHADQAAVVEAMSAGQNAIGVRVRPLVACAVEDSTLCADRPLQMGVLALRGRQSRISYVRFDGGGAAEWVSSAGTAR